MTCAADDNAMCSNSLCSCTCWRPKQCTRIWIHRGL